MCRDDSEGREMHMTIKEIAQLAGVSSAAVSRYLNGGYVSEEKKEQIKKVIDETGYQPSAQARILRTKKACLVGVVVPKINSESISRVTAGIEQVLSARGYQMLLASTDNDPEINKKDKMLSHPKDASQWEALNFEYPEFGNDPRNIVLGTSTDGVNPFGSQRSTHSTWPVFVWMYNLPPGCA